MPEAVVVATGAETVVLMAVAATPETVAATPETVAATPETVVATPEPYQ